MHILSRITSARSSYVEGTCIKVCSKNIASDFQQALKMSSFKTSLRRFLSKEWSNDKYCDVLRGHIVYMAADESCFSFRVEHDKVLRSEVPQLACQHAEADTRMPFHLQHIHREIPAANVTIRSNVTDVCLIMLHHIKHFNQLRLWVDAGLNSNNTRRFIDINSLAEELGPKVSEALLGLHAFTGTDYTASFMNKGMATPYDIMVNYTSVCLIMLHHIKHFNQLHYNLYDVLWVRTVRYGHLNI